MVNLKAARRGGQRQLGLLGEKKKTEESSRYHVAIEVKITRTKKRDRESIWNAKPSGDSAQGLWESGTTAQTSLSVPPNNRCSTVKVLTVP